MMLSVSQWLLAGNLQLLLCGMLSIAAFLRGAAPERCLAVLLLATALTYRLWHLVLPADEFGPVLDPVHLALDVLLLMGVGAVALRANRYYPLWIAGAQLAAMTAHLAMWLKPTAGLYTFLSGGAFHLEMIFLALGISAHVRRRHRLGGAYPSWLGSR